MRAAIALLPALLFSCAPAPRMEATSAQALATCEARGGIVALAYRAPGPACFTPFPDGGRPCSDSAQCAGGCIAVLDPGSSRTVLGPGRTVSGQCAFYDGPPGYGECAQEVRAGRLALSCAP